MRYIVERQSESDKIFVWDIKDRERYPISKEDWDICEKLLKHKVCTVMDDYDPSVDTNNVTLALLPYSKGRRITHIDTVTLFDLTDNLFGLDVENCNDVTIYENSEDYKLVMSDIEKLHVISAIGHKTKLQLFATQLRRGITLHEIIYDGIKSVDTLELEFSNTLDSLRFITDAKWVVQTLIIHTMHVNIFNALPISHNNRVKLKSYDKLYFCVEEPTEIDLSFYDTSELDGLWVASLAGDVNVKVIFRDREQARLWVIAEDDRVSIEMVILN